MSNTGQTPYEKYKSLLGYLSSSQTVSLANETIESMNQRIAELESQVEFEMNEKGLARMKRDEYAKRVNDLQIRIDDLKRGLDKIFKVVSSFNNGIQILTCDGMVHLTLSEYNSLVQAINTAE